MTDSAGTLTDVRSLDGPFFLQDVSRRIIFGVVAIGFGTAAAAWVIAGALTTEPHIAAKMPAAPKTFVPADPYGRLAGTTYSFGPAQVPADPGLAADVALNALPPRPPAAPLPPATASQPADVPPPAKLVLSDVGSAVDSALDAATSPSPASAPEPASVPQPPSPQRAGPELTKSAPLPPPRLPARAQERHEAARSVDRRTAPQAIAAAAGSASAAPDNRNFFQKLFDMPQQPSGPVLAYAQPEDGSISSRPAYSTFVAAPSLDGHTAVYDIAAHTVYMPNGERLEAHSGLGNRLDDPSHVNEKNRGATPPHVYDLALRRPLFHGVPALRLTPVGDGNMYGRSGILAHTYMLGPNGDSNGCVSFKDYSKFLQAFSRGEVKRLVVVPHMS